MNELTLATGVFDLFHVGHLRYLQQASALAKGQLLVGVVSDAEAQRVKGRLPLVPEQQRLELVSAVTGVQAVRLQPISTDNASAVDWIHARGVTQVILSANGKKNKNVQLLEKTLKQRGIALRYLPQTAPISSSGIREQLATPVNMAVSPTLAGVPQIDLPFKPKQLNKNRVLVTGVFDLLHYGHLRFLQQAVQRGDELLVGVLSDELVYANKGRYPVFTLEQRRELLQGLNCVDAVLTIEESLHIPEFSIAWLQALAIDQLICCSQWQGTNHWQRFESALNQEGIEMSCLPTASDISSLLIQQRIAQKRASYLV